MSADVAEVRIDADGHTLYARRRDPGAGTPCVVLLSGIGFHTFEYEPLAAQLAARGIGSLSFDFRGHGHSTGPRGDWRLSDLATDTLHAITHVVDAEPDPHPVHLFGNSLGAMVAILAGARTDVVCSVIASNAPAHVAEFMLTRPRRALYTAAKPLAGHVALRIGLHHFYDYRDLIDDTAWIERIRHDPLIAPARRLTLATYRELLEQWDGPTAVRNVPQPLLIVRGARDRFQPADQTNQLVAARQHGAEHIVIDAGHLPHLDDPAGAADIIAGWIHAHP